MDSQWQSVVGFKKLCDTGLRLSCQYQLSWSWHRWESPWFDTFRDDQTRRYPPKLAYQTVAYFCHRIDWREWNTAEMSATSGARLKNDLRTTQGITESVESIDSEQNRHNWQQFIFSEKTIGADGKRWIGARHVASWSLPLDGHWEAFRWVKFPKIESIILIL
jgi:hypothetical protein